MIPSPVDAEPAPPALPRAAWSKLAPPIALAALLAIACVVLAHLGREPSLGDPILLPIPADGQPFDMKPGSVRERLVTLKAGDFYQVDVAQGGVDVEVRLVDPEGETVLTADTPTEGTGSEELAVVVDASGEHRLVVEAFDLPTNVGQSTVRTLAHRPATDVDRELVAVDAAYRDAEASFFAGSADEAIETLRAVLSSLQRLQEAGTSVALRKANALYLMGKAYELSGDVDIALASLDEAATAYRAIDRPFMVAMTLHRTSLIRSSAESNRRALSDSREAVEAIRRVAPNQQQRKLETQLASLHHHLGDLRSALDILDRHRRADEEAGVRQSAAAAETLLHLGSLYISLNRPREAVDALSSAQESLRTMEDPIQAAHALSLRSYAAQRVGDLHLAEDSLGDARSLLESVAFTPDSENETKRLHALGNVLVASSRLDTLLGRAVDARAALETALEVSRRSSERQLEGAVLQELGSLRLEQGDAAGALQPLDESLSLFQSIEDLTGQAMARVRLAGALHRLDRLDDAWSMIEPTLDWIETLRESSSRVDVQRDYFAWRQEFFDLATIIALDRHERSPGAGFDVEALGVHDRRRARELVDRLSRSPGTREVPTELAAEESRLSSRLVALMTSFGARPLEPEVFDLVDRLRDVRGRIDRALDDPARRVDPRLDMTEILSRVTDADTRVLVYFLGPERGALWSLDDRKVEVYPLPGRRNIESLSREVSTSIAFGTPGAESSLSHLLLGPLRGRLDKSRLVFVAMGELQRLPFAALPSPEFPGERLIHRHEIVVLPSLSTLIALEERGQPAAASPSVIAFGDPVFHESDPRVSRRDAPVERDTTAERTDDLAPFESALQRSATDLFPRLQKSADEVETIKKLGRPFDLRIKVGFSATRESLLAVDPTRTDGDPTSRSGPQRLSVLHFATHAVQVLEHPELSGLVLSRLDAEGRTIDGLVHSYEIATMQLPAELVVLSACETGVGKQVSGEGVLSLTRSFLTAGAQRVISTLWRIDDVSTSRLMASFYEAYFGRGLGPAAALRQAQLTLLEDPKTAAPYYWAGFMLQGSWQHPKLTLATTNNRPGGPPVTQSTEPTESTESTESTEGVEIPPVSTATGDADSPKPPPTPTPDGQVDDENEGSPEDLQRVVDRKNSSGD